VNHKYKISDCNIITLSPIHNRSGNIAIIENRIHIPFDVKRVYWLYDVPAGAERGGHAHRQLEQLIVAVSGSFDVRICDGRDKKTETLRQPFQAFHIKQGIWRDIVNFSSGSVCLVLASEKYFEADYIRDYDDFLEYRGITVR